MMAIASSGKPTDCSTTVSVTMTTPGMPGEPMVPRVAAITMVTIMGQVSSMLYSCATNTAVMPCMMALPSMFSVAPRGRVKDATFSETPMLRQNSME